MFGLWPNGFLALEEMKLIKWRQFSCIVLFWKWKIDVEWARAECLKGEGWGGQIGEVD